MILEDILGWGSVFAFICLFLAVILMHLEIKRIEDLIKTLKIFNSFKFVKEKQK